MKPFPTRSSLFGAPRLTEAEELSQQPRQGLEGKPENLVFDAPTPPGLGALPPPVMPGSDAAVGKAPDTQLLAASVSFGVGQAESAHLTESGEPVGHAGFHHLPVDGLPKPALVEDADDASKLVCWVPNLAVESFVFSDALESLGCLASEGLVVFGRVDGVEPNFKGFAGPAEPAEARRYATVAIVNADDSYGEGFAAAEVQGVALTERLILRDRIREGAVCFGGHDEVVTVEAAYLVGPPVDGDPSPLGDQLWVMSFFLGDGTNGCREVHGLLEISEAETASKTVDAVHFDEIPIGNYGV